MRWLDKPDRYPPVAEQGRDYFRSTTRPGACRTSGLHPSVHRQSRNTVCKQQGTGYGYERLCCHGWGSRTPTLSTRLDLQWAPQLTTAAEQQVKQFLLALSHPVRRLRDGPDAIQLLSEGDPGAVIYSFLLYERGSGANLLRVTDR